MSELFPVCPCAFPRLRSLVYRTPNHALHVLEWGFLSEFLLPVFELFPVGLAFPVFGGTSALPCMRPKDHGSGRLNATNVGRACRYGRRLLLSGRRHGNRLASGSLATYVTLHFYFRSLAEMAA